MYSTASALQPRPALGPVRWIGRAVLASTSYVGGVTILALASLGRALWPSFSRESDEAPGFMRTVMYQLGWMLFMGMPLVGMVHVAIGSFLSLQAYYGSTFVDGTGAVVGVGLLRNLGGLMTGMTFAGLLAARMIPELRVLSCHQGDGQSNAPRVRPAGVHRVSAERTLHSIPRSRLAAPRIVAAAIACLLLSQWGVFVGTFVGWQASQSMMGLSTEMFFMMMVKMMWFRDVMGLIFKGLLFGALPGAICCYEGLAPFLTAGEREATAPSIAQPASGFAPACSMPAFRATCLSLVGILVLNSSWFVLVYHAVPFYGPTLLPPPGP
jgi:phospholipid/cholesterol/gamma-HCH transport system permease protein